uniref:Uncharacterized protein n=1 Tax=Globodera rostochiensis TaxID=31243 RepID=A0A914GVQ1_GLORO
MPLSAESINGGDDITADQEHLWPTFANNLDPSDEVRLLRDRIAQLERQQTLMPPTTSSTGIGAAAGTSGERDKIATEHGGDEPAGGKEVQAKTAAGNVGVNRDGRFHTVYKQKAAAAEAAETEKHKAELLRLNVRIKRARAENAFLDGLMKKARFSKLQHGNRQVAKFRHHKEVLVYDQQYLQQAAASEDSLPLDEVRDGGK